PDLVPGGPAGLPRRSGLGGLRHHVRALGGQLLPTGADPSGRPGQPEPRRGVRGLLRGAGRTVRADSRLPDRGDTRLGWRGRAEPGALQRLAYLRLRVPSGQRGTDPAGHPARPSRGRDAWPYPPAGRQRPRVRRRHRRRHPGFHHHRRAAHTGWAGRADSDLHHPYREDQPRPVAGARLVAVPRTAHATAADAAAHAAAGTPAAATAAHAAATHAAAAHAAASPAAVAPARGRWPAGRRASAYHAGMARRAVTFDWGGTLTPWHLVDHDSLWRTACAPHFPAGRTAEVAAAILAAERELWLAGERSHRSATLAQVFERAGVMATEELLASYYQ